MKETLADLEATNPKLGVFRLRSSRFVGARYAIFHLCGYLEPRSTKSCIKYVVQKTCVIAVYHIPFYIDILEMPGATHFAVICSVE